MDELFILMRFPEACDDRLGDGCRRQNLSLAAFRSQAGAYLFAANFGAQKSCAGGDRRDESREQSGARETGDPWPAKN
jgi:hypothetical protein